MAIAVFGISGLVIGPVVAGLFLTVWTIFGDEFGQREVAHPELEMERTDPTEGPPHPGQVSVVNAPDEASHVAPAALTDPSEPVPDTSPEPAV